MGQICTKGHFCKTVKKMNKIIIKKNRKEEEKISYRPTIRGNSDSTNNDKKITNKN